MKIFTFFILLVFIPLNFAQEKPDHKPSTEIVQYGNILKIPEDKMGEFMKNMDEYVPKKPEQFMKVTGEITLDGYVTDAFTTEPIPNVETTLYLYEGPTLIDTLGPIFTNSQGYYSFIIVSIENENQVKNIGSIEYYGGQVRITTNSYQKIKITAYDILGQEFKTTRTIEKEIDGTEIINLNLVENQLMLTTIEIDGRTYSQIHIRQGNTYSVRAGKNIDHITEVNFQHLEKVTELGARVDFLPPDNQHHRYFSGIGKDLNGDTRHNMALLPRMFLDSAFVDPNYTVIDTIKTFRDLIWDLQIIQGVWDNRQAYPPLYNFRVFLDTSNCPVEWKAPIRDAIRYWRDTMAGYLGMNPDSLIVESPEFNDPTITQGFSAINIYYVNEIPNNYDSWRLVYLDGYERVFTGADISLNLSTGMNYDDVLKEINRNLEEYIVGVAYPFGRNPPGMLIDRRLRGEPYFPTENDLELTKSIKNIQDINPNTYYNGIFP